MNAHELQVYPTHLYFLRDFPELKNWLNCNGFTLAHSHQDFIMQTMYTFWDNHTVDAEQNGYNDAQNSIMVAYCQKCRTVEVYNRAIITKAQDHKDAVDQLEQKIYGVADEYTQDNCNEADVISQADSIDALLEEIAKQNTL